MPDVLPFDFTERLLPQGAAPSRFDPSAGSAPVPAGETDPVAPFLRRALLGPTAAEGVRAIASLHGKLRARQRGTLADLLGEYHALRCQVAGPGEVGIGRHTRIDRASAAAATAFGVERTRQHEVVRLGLDHDLRGYVNAIRLAAFVQRETARDTADVVERHTSGLSALLDRARDALAPRDHAASMPADMPSTSLAATCRRRIDEWNHRQAGPGCDFRPVVACSGHFDTFRVGEALDAMVAAAARRVGASSRLTATLDSVQELAQQMALVTVAGPASAPSSGRSGADRSAPDEWPLIWMLAQQTAADHHGKLETEAGGERVALRLTLRAVSVALP